MVRGKDNSKRDSCSEKACQLSDKRLDLRNYLQALKLLLIIAILVVSIGCGYKPSAKYAREVLGHKISTSMIISQTDPENSVLIKDAVDKAVIEIFHASLTQRKFSDTHLTISISVPSYAPLQYDNNGFIISYRATITLKISRETDTLKRNYTTVGTYDFSVVPNAVLTDQERFDAIKYSSYKAISAFVAQVSAEGALIH